ncbi:hypothetical protein ACFYVR_18305 [Rhodococcus sp. NPDC003318]|uniref:hypothetical protein n=1 Tax=Rhodococcus sp. NPDC003318 TaxID=3364503 RepID=UPI00367A2E73
MTAEWLTCSDFVTATFSHDFVADGYDHDSVERIHRGDIDEWIHALAQSGLFTNLAVTSASESWRDDPHTLLDALLADADEVTVKRYEVAWDAMDRSTFRAVDEYA